MPPHVGWRSDCSHARTCRLDVRLHALMPARAGWMSDCMLSARTCRLDVRLHALCLHVQAGCQTALMPARVGWRSDCSHARTCRLDNPAPYTYVKTTCKVPFGMEMAAILVHSLHVYNYRFHCAPKWLAVAMMTSDANALSNPSCLSHLLNYCIGGHNYL